MDNLKQEQQPSLSSPQFCALCLRARLPNVEFYNDIDGSSGDLQTSLRTLLGYDFLLENLAICKPCRMIMQLFQDFRQRCVRANKLAERIGQGLENEGDWFSERNLEAVESIRTVIKGQLHEINKLSEDSCGNMLVIKSEFTQIKTEPIDLDRTDEVAGSYPVSEANWSAEIEDSAGETFETNLDINEFKIEPDEAYLNDESHTDAEEDELPKPISKRPHSTHTYPCPECSMVFNNHRRLASHVIRHAGNRPFICRNNCEKGFPTSMGRRRHERRCGKEVYQCNLCEDKLDSRRGLYDHYNLVHPGEPKHPCSHCDKRFKKKEQLQRHESRIHSGVRARDLACPECGKAFAENGILRIHMRIHN